MKRLDHLVTILWTAVLSVVFSTSIYESQIIGDGREYLVYARAFAAHLSPAIKEDDIRHVAGILDKSDPWFRANISKLGSEYQINDLRYGHGFVKSPAGELFSWHFWLYPLFVAPFFEMVHVVGLPPATAFTFCNWAIVFGVLSYLLFFWKAHSAQKQLLAALFLLTGTTYYVWWPHPEVYTASLILLALMMADDRRFGLAMVASAFAAAQNPSVVFLLAGIAATATFVVAREQRLLAAGKRENLQVFGKLFLKLSVSLGIVLSPVIYFYNTLGVVNPIAAGGYVDGALIGFDRLWSTYFDFNLGLIVAAPGIAVGIVFILLDSWGRLNERPFYTMVNKNRVLIACGVISVMMAIPTLTTINWNSGQSVYSRYSYWLGVPLVYGLATSLYNLKKELRIVSICIVLSIQLVTVVYYGVFGNNMRSENTEFKPMSKYILQNFPGFYNPVPEIFIERLNRREGIPVTDAENQFVFAYPSIEHPTKLLISDSMVNAVAKKCSSASVVSAEGGWSFVNLPSNSKCDIDLDAVHVEQ